MNKNDLTPSEAQLLSNALRDLAARTRFPVVFGGFTREETVRVSNILGNRTKSLDGLIVRTGRGLGGRALQELRPRMTPDYASSRQITHDYDGHVLGEGISTLIAVPIIVGGTARGVLYGGAWGTSGVGEVVAAPAFHVAEALATELRVRDEVERRLQLIVPTEQNAAQALNPGTLDAATREELRASYAELRSVAASVHDTELRDRLAAIERRLAGLSGDRPDGEAPGEPDRSIRLSPRELDVLACVAIGSTNAEIADALRLREGTVKAYLGSAMSKLDASTRHAAVTAARRHGLLP